MIKKLVFNSLHLLSHSEKGGRSFSFHPTTNIIKGASAASSNSTGKSSLIKSLYGSLGADSAKQTVLWRKAKVVSLLEFSFGEQRYYIYRSDKNFAIFDDRQEIVDRYRRISSELAPALAKILNFELKLPNRQTGNLETPSPAYFFVPFYIDQDAGWKDTLASFNGLTQYSNWKENVILYHIGLRSNRWYELQSIQTQLTADQEEPKRRYEALASLRLRLSKEIAEVPFDIDLDSFKKEVDLLIDSCKSLAHRQETYRQQIVDFENDRIRILAQIEIINKAEDELSSDFSYAAKDLPDKVECPTCGACYENNFIERFSIARDEDRCLTLLQELNDDLEKINDKIEQHKNNLSFNKIEQESIEEALNQKLGDFTLDDILKRKSKLQLGASIDSEIADLVKALNESSLKISAIKKEAQRETSKEKEKHIEKAFLELMNQSLKSLQVYGVEMSKKKVLVGNMDGTGSNLPRAILAYYFSLINTIQAHGNATICPFVIDSPNQNDQDQDNLHLLLNFIKNNRPADSQLFIGLVDDLEIDFGGSVIELREKHKLLSRESYKEVADYIRPFARKANDVDELFE